MADRDPNVAYWPAEVWAGRSPTRDNPSAVHRRPDAEDWEQVIKEMDAVQGFVSDMISESILTVENANSSEEDILPGMPVVVSDGGSGGDIAVNDGTIAAAAAMGIALELITAETAEPEAAAGTGRIQISGIVELTTAEWDAVTGGTGGLSAGDWYFVGDGAAGSVSDAAKLSPSIGFWR